MSGKGAPASLPLLTASVELAGQRTRKEVNMRGVHSLLSLLGSNELLTERDHQPPGRLALMLEKGVLQQDGFEWYVQIPPALLHLFYLSWTEGSSRDLYHHATKIVLHGLCSLELATPRLMEDGMLLQEAQKAGHLWSYLEPQYLRNI